jgi:hypothetical protein
MACRCVLPALMADAERVETAEIRFDDEGCGDDIVGYT